MPLALPFLKQETPYSCVAACLRMVMARYGVEVSEGELRQRSFTTLWRTSARDAVACVNSYGLQAEEIRAGTVDNLREWLNRGLLPILLIDLRPIHGEVGRHAIVAEAIGESQLTYLDPLTERRTSDLDTVEEAWRLNSYRVILISPPPTVAE